MVLPLLAAGIGAAATLGAGFMKAKSAKKSDRANAKAAQQQMGFLREGQDKANAVLAPAAQYQPALSKLMALNGLNGAQEQQNAFGDFRASPGYEWQKNQALEAATRGAAARGGAMSGRATTALAQLGDGFASQDYNDYYNRLNGLFNTQLGTAGQVASGYTGVANGLAGIAGQAGQARADGITAKGNAWTGALQGLAQNVNYGLGQFDAMRNQNNSVY